MRYTFGDALPLAGGAAPLLTAAIAEGWPRSIGALGKRAGISKFAASRAAAVLREYQLLLVDEEGDYFFNDEHPLAPTLTSLAWDFSGVRRDRPSATAAYGRVPSSNDFHYRKLMPPSLSLDAVMEPSTHGLPAGPSMLEARRQFTRLGDFMRPLRNFEDIAQEVYARWGNERLRDVVHATLHFGSATQAARETLALACAEDQQAEQDPASAAITGDAWARAAYLLSAEVSGVLFITRVMATAIQQAAPIHRAHEDALFALSNINYNDNRNNDDVRNSQLDEALASEAEASQQWDRRFSPTGLQYASFGGTPRPRDVGSAGDQILAIELLAAATTMAAEVKQMANHPCLHDWAAAHPEESTKYRLVTDVPDDILTPDVA